MIRISYFKINERDYEKIFSIFYKILGESQNKKEFSKILFDLLTPAERIMLIKRIAVMYLLLKDINYLTICEVLKVSNGTVSKYKLLMEDSKGIVPVLNKMIKIEKVWLFFEEIFSHIFHPGKIGINWKDAWKIRMDLERKKEKGM
ncbi:conserved hypothetical protein [Candidatus Roizmanbacteria bacterium]|nr:conserved hypothetical protein [Candidatus Roizmanbacteria bacterium]